MKTIITLLLLLVLIPITNATQPNGLTEGVYTVSGDNIVDSPKTIIVDLTDPTGYIRVDYNYPVNPTGSKKANALRNWNNILVIPTVLNYISSAITANDNFEKEGSFKNWEIRRWKGKPFDDPTDINKPWVKCDLDPVSSLTPLGYTVLKQGATEDYITISSTANTTYTPVNTEVAVQNTKNVINEECYVYQLYVEDESGRALNTNETSDNNAANWTEAVYIDRTQPHVAINATTSLCKTPDCSNVTNPFNKDNISTIFKVQTPAPASGQLYDFQENTPVTQATIDTALAKDDASYDANGLVVTAWTNHDIELSLNLGDNESGLASGSVTYTRNDGLPLSAKEDATTSKLPFPFCGTTTDTNGVVTDVKGKYDTTTKTITCDSTNITDANPKHFAPNWKFNTRDLRDPTNPNLGKDEGVHKLILSGTDFAGNKVNATIILRIDKTAPKLTWSNTLEGSVNNNVISGKLFGNKFLAGDIQTWTFNYNDFNNGNNSTNNLDNKPDLNKSYISQVRTNTEKDSEIAKDPSKIKIRVYRCNGSGNTVYDKAEFYNDKNSDGKEDNPCTDANSTEITNIIENQINKNAPNQNLDSYKYKNNDLPNSWVDAKKESDNWATNDVKNYTDSAVRSLQLYHSQYYNGDTTGRYKIVFDVTDIAGNDTATVNPAEPNNANRGKTLEQIIIIEPNQMTDDLKDGGAKGLADQTNLYLDPQCNQKVKRVYEADGVTLKGCIVGGTYTYDNPVEKDADGKFLQYRIDTINDNQCGSNITGNTITTTNLAWITAGKNNLETKVHCMIGGNYIDKATCNDKYIGASNFEVDANTDPDIYRWKDPTTSTLKCVIGGLLKTNASDCTNVATSISVTAGQYTDYAWDSGNKCRLDAEYQEGTKCGGLDFLADSVTACNGIIRLKDALANPISNRPNISLVGSSQTSLDQVHDKLLSDPTNEALFFLNEGANTINNTAQGIRTATDNFKTNKNGEVIFQMVAYAPTLPIMESSQTASFTIKTATHNAVNVHDPLVPVGANQSQPENKPYMVTPVYYPDDWADRPNKLRIDADLPFKLNQPYYGNPNLLSTDVNYPLIYPTTPFTLGNMKERQSKLGIYFDDDRVNEFNFQHYSIQDSSNKGTHISNIETGIPTLFSGINWNINTPNYSVYKDRLTVKGTVSEIWDITPFSSSDDDDMMMWFNHDDKDKNYEFRLHYQRIGGLSPLTTEPLLSIKPFTQYKLGETTKEKVVVYPLEKLDSNNEPVFYQKTAIESGGLIQSSLSQNVSKGDEGVNAMGSMAIETFMAPIRKAIKQEISDLNNSLNEGIITFRSGSNITTDNINPFTYSATKDVNLINDNRTYIVKGKDLEINGNDNGEIILGDKSMTFATYGGNITINANIKYDPNASPGSVKPTIAFIAFRDEKTGTGGEIRIPNIDNKGNALLNLAGTFIAERGVIAVYNDNTDLTNLDRSEKMINQLIIKGTIMSFNTLGGGNLKEFTKSDGTKYQEYMCPKFIQKKDCTQDLAQKYDLNFLRRYESTDRNSTKSVDPDDPSITLPTDQSVIIKFYFNDLFKPKELYE